MAYAGLFVSAFLASTILPASSETVLAGLLLTNTGEPLLLFVVALMGNTAGSILNWLLGRGIAHWRDRAWFPVKEKEYSKAERLFARFGLWSLLFAWLPIIGDPLTVIAGALRIPFWRFLALVAAGKAARYAVIIWGIAWLG